MRVPLFFSYRFPRARKRLSIPFKRKRDFLPLFPTFLERYCTPAVSNRRPKNHTTYRLFTISARYRVWRSVRDNDAQMIYSQARRYEDKARRRCKINVYGKWECQEVFIHLKIWRRDLLVTHKRWILYSQQFTMFKSNCEWLKTS